LVTSFDLNEIYDTLDAIEENFSDAVLLY